MKIAIFTLLFVCFINPLFADDAETPFSFGTKKPFIKLDEKGEFYLYASKTKKDQKDAILIEEHVGEDKRPIYSLTLNAGVYFASDDLNKNSGMARSKVVLLSDDLARMVYLYNKKEVQLGSVSTLELTSRCFGCPVATEYPLSIKVNTDEELDLSNIAKASVKVQIQKEENGKTQILEEFTVPLADIQNLAPLRGYSNLEEVEEIILDSNESWSYSSESESISITNPTITFEGKKYLLLADSGNSIDSACKMLGHKRADKGYKGYNILGDAWTQNSNIMIDGIFLKDNKVQRVEPAKEYIHSITCIKNLEVDKGPVGSDSDTSRKHSKQSTSAQTSEDKTDKAAQQ